MVASLNVRTISRNVSLGYGVRWQERREKTEKREGEKTHHTHQPQLIPACKKNMWVNVTVLIPKDERNSH